MPKFHDRCQLATEELMSQFNLSAQEAGEVFLFLLRTQGSATSLAWFTDSLQGFGVVPSDPAGSEDSSGGILTLLEIPMSQAIQTSSELGSSSEILTSTAGSTNILIEARLLLAEIFPEFS